jgi:drug/metabolite transporter superfamily protein YnfA
MALTGSSILAVLAGFIGLCWVVGWARSFRRPYVLLMGLFMFALAGALLTSGQARRGLFAASGLLFVVAMTLAVTETVRNVRRIQDEQRALEMQMMAYAEKIMKEHEAKAAGEKDAGKQSEPGEKSA